MPILDLFRLALYSLVYLDPAAFEESALPLHLEADRSGSNSEVDGDDEELSFGESFGTVTQTPKFCCAYSSARSSEFT